MVQVGLRKKEELGYLLGFAFAVLWILGDMHTLYGQGCTGCNGQLPSRHEVLQMKDDYFQDAILSPGGNLGLLQWEGEFELKDEGIVIKDNLGELFVDATFPYSSSSDAYKPAGNRMDLAVKLNLLAVEGDFPVANPRFFSEEIAFVVEVVDELNSDFSFGVKYSKESNSSELEIQPFSSSEEWQTMNGPVVTQMLNDGRLLYDLNTSINFHPRIFISSEGGELLLSSNGQNEFSQGRWSFRGIGDIYSWENRKKFPQFNNSQDISAFPCFNTSQDCFNPKNGRYRIRLRALKDDCFIPLVMHVWFNGCAFSKDLNNVTASVITDEDVFLANIVNGKRSGTYRAFEPENRTNRDDDISSDVLVDLQRDDFVILKFNGNVLFDMEPANNNVVLQSVAANRYKLFLNKSALRNFERWDVAFRCIAGTVNDCAESAQPVIFDWNVRVRPKRLLEIVDSFENTYCYEDEVSNSEIFYVSTNLNSNISLVNVTYNESTLLCEDCSSAYFSIELGDVEDYGVYEVVAECASNNCIDGETTVSSRFNISKVPGFYGDVPEFVVCSNGNIKPERLPSGNYELPGGAYFVDPKKGEVTGDAVTFFNLPWSESSFDLKMVSDVGCEKIHTIPVSYNDFNDSPRIILDFLDASGTGLDYKISCDAFHDCIDCTFSWNIEDDQGFAFPLFSGREIDFDFPAPGTYTISIHVRSTACGEKSTSKTVEIVKSVGCCN